VDNVILHYILPRSLLQETRGSCFKDTTTTIILASSNEISENEIEMHSACLRPLSRLDLPRSSFFRWKKTGSGVRGM